MSKLLKFLFSFLIFVAVCYVGLMWFMNHEVDKALNESIDSIKGLTLEYADLNVSIADATVTLKNVETTLPDGQHMTADEVRITAFDQLHPIPYFVAAEADGVTVEATPANVGGWAGSMLALNIPVIKGNVSLDYRYDPESKSMDLKTLAIRIPELGDADISGTVDSIDLQLLRMEKFFGLRIKKANLKFTNHSFINTLVRESARGLNVSETDALAQISAELVAMADYAGKDGNQVAENALRGLKRYINDPGTVTITANPSEPVPVLYFFMGRDMYDNLRMMNVEIKTDSSEDI